MRSMFTFLCVLVGGCGIAVAAVVTRGPYLQSAGADRITVCWRTNEATTSELSYGLTTEALSAPESPPGTRTDHVITLTGLQSATKFFYRIQGTPAAGAAVDVGGPQYWFRTSPAAGTAAPTRIWVVGDTGYQSSDPQVEFVNFMDANAASGRATDLFLMLGDNAYGNGTDAEYQGAVFNRYQPLLKNTPIWSTVGNHDDTTVPAVPPAPYYSIFTFPTAGECGGVASGTEKYYSFNHSNIHFVCIDANTSESVADAPGGTYGMVDWLRDDLEGCSADWIVAYMHEGPYSKGTHDSDSEWNLVMTRNHIIPLLEQYGADLVLFGHSHAYERSRLIDGHYGSSTTWNAATMVKQAGNGSDLGGVDASGNFTTTASNGAYLKPAALTRSGTVYAEVGASSSAQGWFGGSNALVSPAPHPAHVVNLNLIGSMVIEVNANRLNAQYLDISGAIRDDFTIVKGSTYSLHGAAPAFSNEASPGISFAVTRTGTVALAEQVPVAAEWISGGTVTPAQAIADFPIGQSGATVMFTPSTGQPGARFQARVLPTLRPLLPGAAARSAYHISGVPQAGQFAATPAATWYASRFAETPPAPGVWETDGDGDGLTLQIEYALGGEPGRNDLDLLPKANIEGASWVYRYRRAPGRSDLVYRIKASSDLLTWPLPDPLDVNDGPSSVLGEPRKAEIPLGDPKRFLKLEATKIP